MIDRGLSVLSGRLRALIERPYGCGGRAGGASPPLRGLARGLEWEGGSGLAETTQRGYLEENYRLFHIRDRRELSIEWHYHAFDKAVFFLSGRVDYTVEDRAYRLRPGDVLLVRHGCAHRPEIDPGEVYERYILYMDPGYLAAPGRELDLCFARAWRGRQALLTPDAAGRASLTRLLSELEGALRSSAFAHDLLADALFVQVLVALNRLSLGAEERPGADPRIAGIVEYIGENLAGDLSVEALAQRFFVSESFLTHRFREETGYAPHSYVQLRRLLFAAGEIARGAPAAEAGRMAGYEDYSAFSRAFVKRFGVSPGRYRRGAPMEET